MEAIDTGSGARGAHSRGAMRANVVGHYELRHEIASGGMATVHLARDLEAAAPSEAIVAIKRLHAQYARDPEFTTMFADEARLAARITHRNVIPVLDVVTEDHELFLVMEYVHGAPLSRLRTRAREHAERHGGNGAIPPAIAVRIVCDVLAGLHAAHEARNDYGESLGIVHRDVSPQNVMVGTDGVARVFDFGIAKAAGRLQVTRRGQLKGKLSYMAPEQIQEELVSRSTDVYAASVVLWEMLTGKRLFLGNDEQSTLSNVLSSAVPAPSEFAPSVSKELDEIVLRGLDRQPSRRYSAAHEMVLALSQSCPLAASTEVGDWVVLLAREELARSTKMVEAAELHEPMPESGHRMISEIAQGISEITSRDVTASDLRRLPACVEASAASQPSLDCNDSLTSESPRASAGVMGRLSWRTLLLALTLLVGAAPAATRLLKHDGPAQHAKETDAPARPTLSLSTKVAEGTPNGSSSPRAHAPAHAANGERPPSR